MPHPRRDPETGQFVSTEEMLRQFDDIEAASGSLNIVIPAADLTGATGTGWGEGDTFEGVTLYDLDSLLDRSEMGVLVYAYHRVAAFVKGTQTADGAVKFNGEISTSGVLEASDDPQANVASDVGDNDSVDIGGVAFNDTLDLIGPPIITVGGGNFSDGATGVGGATSGDAQVWEGRPAADEFHPRDQVFLNGLIEVQNVADAAVDILVTYQHQYGVRED